MYTVKKNSVPSFYLVLAVRILRRALTALIFGVSDRALMLYCPMLISPSGRTQLLLALIYSPSYRQSQVNLYPLIDCLWSVFLRVNSQPLAHLVFCLIPECDKSLAGAIPILRHRRLLITLVCLHGRTKI